MADEIENLAVGLAADHQEKKRRRAKAETADTVAAGAIEGAGAALDAGGDARDVAAATIGGAAAATADVLDDDGKAEMRQAVDSFGKSVEEHGDDEKPSLIAERIERIQAEAPIDARYATGDLFALMLDLFKTRGKPWSEMLEDEQRQVAIALKSAVTDSVGRVVHLVRAGGAGSFTAKLEGYTNKGAFKINLTAEATRDTSNALFDAEGQFVTVQRADPAQFSGTRAGSEPQFDADQGGLGFESDSDNPPADPFADSDDNDQDADPADADRDLADDLDDDQDPE